jgi:phosphopantothenoylcysteine decarboxylase/phosphopantothenate--cysteine ligase
MFVKTMSFYDTSDIVIMSAAVSDYKPAEFSEKKLKKNNKELNVKFKKTKDILFELGKIKSKQFLVGFALENENETENAKIKMKKKNLDLIVLNSLNDKGAGFGYDTNKVKIIDSLNKTHSYKLKQKTEVAEDIFKHIIQTI